MYEDHFAKLPVPPEQEFSTVHESQIYSIIPSDQLFTLKDVILRCFSSRDAPQNEATIRKVFGHLLEKRLFKKLPGVHVQRYAERF